MRSLLAISFALVTLPGEPPVLKPGGRPALEEAFALGALLCLLPVCPAMPAPCSVAAAGPLAETNPVES